MVSQETSAIWNAGGHGHSKGGHSDHNTKLADLEDECNTLKQANNSLMEEIMECKKNLSEK